MPTTNPSCAYSWIKNFALYCTAGGGTTSLSAMQVKHNVAMEAGCKLHFKAVAVASYAQAGAGTLPANGTTRLEVPAGYTAMTNAYQQYDAGPDAATNATPVGDICVTLLGVDDSNAGGYIKGAGSAIKLGTGDTDQSIYVQYNEAAQRAAWTKEDCLRGYQADPFGLEPTRHL